MKSSGDISVLRFLNSTERMQEDKENNKDWVSGKL